MARPSGLLPRRPVAAVDRRRRRAPNAGVVTMDTAVSLRKFEAEVRSLNAKAADYAAAKGWTIAMATYPTLSVVLRHSVSNREIEFRLACDDWDEQPPSLSLHYPVDGKELSWEDWPRGGWDVHESHTSTGKPFLCLQGIREYHTHSSHLSDRWDGYRLRGTYGLLGIVDRVQQRFEDSNG